MADSNKTKGKETIEDPFNSDSSSTEDIQLIDKQTSQDKSKALLPLDPSIVQMNNKLLKDIQNLSIHDDNLNNVSNYDPSYDILHLEDDTILDNDSVDGANKTSYKDDMVYLSNIYNVFEKISSKLDDLIASKFVDKQLIREIHQNALEENFASIIKQTKKVLSDEEACKIAYSSVKSLLEDLPAIIQELEKNVIEIKSHKKEYEMIIEKVMTIANSLSLVVGEFEITMSDKIKDFILVFNGINIKYQLNTGHKEPKMSDKRSLAFTSKEIDCFLNSIIDSFVKINNEISKVNADFELLKSNKDINALNKTIENNKKTISRLQEENIAFSDAVNKLNEINIKLKKECVLISSEYKKLVDVNKEKKKIIEKQRRLIELLQNKVGDKLNDPLSEIKSKMSNLKLEIENEKDSKKKDQLVKKYEETQKRLEDFEALYNKNK